MSQPAAVLSTGEWIGLESVVQGVHQNDEQQRCEWVALTKAALESDGESTSEAVDGSNARSQTRQTINDEANKG